MALDNKFPVSKVYLVSYDRRQYSEDMSLDSGVSRGIEPNKYTALHRFP